ncbi:MAG: DNA-directed RNA polymerase subunit alpha [Candidatus Andersenbacteria bacterium]
MLDKIKLPTHVTITPDAKNKWRGVLVLEPLHPGYGTTLGNSLRRVLLASLPGAAITAVKIKGVEHEFSAMSGVKEDVIAIILNLKKVRLTSHAAEPVKLTLEKKGEGPITAGDFAKSSEVEIVNPDLVIAHGTSKDTTVSMEVTVEQGRGYVPVEDREKEQLEIGTIAIDSIYTPVKNVSMDVSSARVGQITNFDKLTMTIETDGTLTPQEAAARAASLLIDHLNLFVKDIKLASDTEKRVPVLETVAATPAASLMGAPTPATTPEALQAAVLDKPIEELELSTRTLNALYNNDVKKIKDVVKMSEQELADLQGLGGKALAEITKALKKFNLSLSGGMGA